MLPLKRKFASRAYHRGLTANPTSQHDLDCIKDMVERIKDGLEDIYPTGAGNFWQDAYYKIACRHRLELSHYNKMGFDMIVLTDFSPHP